jgi:hypothetical protein
MIKRIVNWFKDKYYAYKRKKMLAELRKRDPFIY